MLIFTARAQNELARAEAYNIALTDHQYVVATNGLPIRGLIQDHVVMGVLLTKKDTLFTRDMFQQLLYAACSSLAAQRKQARCQTPIITLPPCILKPVP